MADAVGNAVAQVGQTVNTTSILWVVLIILGVVLFLSVAGVITYFMVRKRKFNKFVVVFEKVSGKFEVVLRTRAMITKFGRSGDQVLLLMKGKKILPRPEIQTGRNNYWFVIREDGEWINIGLEDIDYKFREMNANFLHPEIRYQRTSIQEGMIKERYEKSNWWKENWHILVSVFVIVILLVFMFLNTSKMGDVAKANEGASAQFTQTAQIIANATAEIGKAVAHLDSINSGGSGLVSSGG